MPRGHWPWMMLALAGCAQDEMSLRSLVDEPVGLEVRAPKASLKGGCGERFDARFCAEEYEAIGVLEVSAGEQRLITLPEAVTETQCTNVLWLRLVRFGEVGPLDDPGALFELPVDAEIERGAGALHAVAFPQATVRLDEVGTLDARQARPPASCAALGRSPR